MLLLVGHPFLSSLVHKLTLFNNSLAHPAFLMTNSCPEWYSGYPILHRSVQ
jgi:hypothetical protein